MHTATHYMPWTYDQESKEFSYYPMHDADTVYDKRVEKFGTFFVCPMSKQQLGQSIHKVKPTQEEWKVYLSKAKKELKKRSYRTRSTLPLIAEYALYNNLREHGYSVRMSEELGYPDTKHWDISYKFENGRCLRIDLKKWNSIHQNIPLGDRKILQEKIVEHEQEKLRARRG